MEQSDVNLNWLNSSLSTIRQEASIVGFEIEDVGIGSGFAGTVLRAALTYDISTEAPATVILKLPVKDEYTMEALKAQAVLLREVKFYEQLVNRVPVKVPRIYHLECNDDDYAIIMQDMGDIKRAEWLEMSVAEARPALIALAKWHAEFWNDPVLQEAWLSPVTDANESSRQRNFEQLQRALSILKQSKQPTEHSVTAAEKLLELFPKTPDRVPLPKPTTLTHGDYHINNLHIDNNDVLVFDFQLVAEGMPSLDVANLLFTSLGKDDYEQHEESLLQLYHQTLIDSGVRKYSFRKFKRGYADAKFTTFLKFLVVLGTIDFNFEGGEEYQTNTIEKVELNAQWSDAIGYSRKLPFIFFVMRLINVTRNLLGTARTH